MNWITSNRLSDVFWELSGYLGLTFSDSSGSGEQVRRWMIFQGYPGRAQAEGTGSSEGGNVGRWAL